MYEIFFFSLVFLCGLSLGDVIADEATFKQCATQNETYLMGSGKIKCEVIKDGK